MDEETRAAFETLLAAIHAMHSAVVARLDALIRRLEAAPLPEDEEEPEEGW